MRQAPVRSYGSIPGELAVCVRHVGLAQRSDLAATWAGGEPRALETITGHVTGHSPAVGGSVLVAGAWWCRPDAGTLLLVGAPDALARAVDLLRTHARRHPGLVVDTDRDRLAVLGVVGRLTVELLRGLDVYGPRRDPREAPPCTPIELGGAQTVWLLESDVSAICCVDRAEAGAAEDLIATAGRQLGLARIGRDALEQYMLLERRRTTAALRPSA